MQTEPIEDAREQLAAFRDALADIAFACAFTSPDGGSDQVTALVTLIQSHPHWCAAFDTSGAARLIAADADAAAALALVEPMAGYMLSCVPGGRHLVTIVLAGQSQEFHAEGASAALALVGALASALAGSRAGSTVADQQARPAPEIRLN